MQRRASNVQRGEERRNILIERYWNYLEDKPDLTFKEFEEICKTPFRHTRKRLAEEVLYDIRLKGLGQFTPSSSSLLHMLKVMHTKHTNGNMSTRMYDQRVKTITDYIAARPERFEHLKLKLKTWISL